MACSKCGQNRPRTNSAPLVRLPMTTFQVIGGDGEVVMSYDSFEAASLSAQTIGGTVSPVTVEKDVPGAYGLFDEHGAELGRATNLSDLQELRVTYPFGQIRVVPA